MLSKRPKADLSRLQTNQSDETALQTIASMRDDTLDRPMRSRAPRSDSWAVCDITMYGGEKREGVVVNISKSGARIRFRSKGYITEKMVIKCARFRLNRPARLVWKDAFDIGIEFYQPAQK